jgi:hypothetical protein
MLDITGATLWSLIFVAAVMAAGTLVILLGRETRGAKLTRSLPERLKRRLSRSRLHCPGNSTMQGRSDGVVGERGGRMKQPPREEEREQRITMEIIVDAYTPEEQAIGWYYSLEDRLHFPFVARCIAERSISPLRRRGGRRRRDGPRRGVPARDVRPDPLGTPSPCSSLGAAGGHRGG